MFESVGTGASLLPSTGHNNIYSKLAQEELNILFQIRVHNPDIQRFAEPLEKALGNATKRQRKKNARECNIGVKV